MQLAHFIDHTVLTQTTTAADVARVCSEAVEYGFAAVCVPPVYVAQSMGILKSFAPKVCTVVGFPFGYHHISVKAAEAAQAVAAGAQELDMVLNLTALKNADLDILRAELEMITRFSKAHGVISKVIIESGILSDAEIKTVCGLCAAFPIDFVKTSTGYAEKGATVAAVQLLRALLPSTIQIKASGGIKTVVFAEALLAAGAARLGCTASVALVKEAANEAG